MKNRSIAIIGRGSIGAIALLRTLESLKEYNKLDSVDITIFYDPSIPITHVGEATTWVVFRALQEVLGKRAEEVLRESKATWRKGMKFFWDQNDFNIDYLSYGIHFDSAVFSKYVIEEVNKAYDNVNIIEEKVTSVSNKTLNHKYAFDLILDVSGSPSREELKYGKEYITPQFQTVNSVLLYLDSVDKIEDMSEAHFHENGWMFGIPLVHRKAFGYLYNRNLTTHTEAELAFRKLKNIPPNAELRSLEWNFYYRRKMVDNDVVYLGNKLYFFEPAQALPIHFYYIQLDNLYQRYFSMWDLDIPTQQLECELNNNYIEDIYGALNIIAFNYSGTTSVSSNFWDTIGTEARDFLKHSEYAQDWLARSKASGRAESFWDHDVQLVDNYVRGFNIEMEKLDGDT